MKEEDGGTPTKPNHLLRPRGSVRHIVQCYICHLTARLYSVKLSLFSIIGVLHRTGDSNLGEIKPPDKPVLLLGAVES